VFLDVAVCIHHFPIAYSASQMNMKLMHKYIVSNLSKHWGALSDFLEYPTSVKKTFSRPNPWDSMMLLLEDWISTDNGRKPKTWEVFIEVLNELGEVEGQPVLNITRWIVQCLLQEGVIKSESTIHCTCCSLCYVCLVRKVLRTMYVEACKLLLMYTTYFSVLCVVATFPAQTQTTPPTGGMPAGGLFRDGTFYVVYQDTR